MGDKEKKKQTPIIVLKGNDDIKTWQMQEATERKSNDECR